MKLLLLMCIFIKVFQNRNLLKKNLRPVKPMSKVFVIGLPKTGTTSLHEFFKCGGRSSAHWRCVGKRRCGECIEFNVRRGRPPVQGCGDFDVYAQIDVDADGNHSCYFPQIDALATLYRHYPRATYILNTRPFDHWNRSIHHWHDMYKRLRYKCRWPFVQANDTDFFRRLHRQVQLHARSFQREHPEMHLVDIDIESNVTGRVLSSEFGIPEACWTQKNKS
jgi:hypothetical protein